ncbi:aminoglycoside phosphotransferase [Paenibacillus mucilaginosus 3016]|uniref:Aminoglycoside phosphotransferase n=1 Tax=Paenibacillus mucilaginosus 3016 TaxID=1116391 RepID=H6NMW1_9BACL|nr:aminoglycoside phosphotransferase family protein [Paenibacillus mucilaginosus]AFC31001.1 aminoglycoside phosphotransferase [Paenibacillus mucilaginosus 3016]WFA19595.1 aminoglycoside phosphotransferase [Paenibacillus mucilaginosus]
METKLGRKIGEGGCSEVYEYGTEQPAKIIKLAKSNTSMDAMRNEYRNHRTAWELGLPVPQPFDLRVVDGRPGIVVEQIQGETLMQRFLRGLDQPEVSEDSPIYDDVRMTARILNALHSQSAEALPSQRESIKGALLGVESLTAPEKKQICAILDDLPVKQRVCHGDPNPGNIFVRHDEGLLIDWMNASAGNPEADLAEYILMVRYAVLPSHLGDRIIGRFHSIREMMIDAFMEEYTRLSGVTAEEVDPWLLPMAARKLTADAISDEEKGLLVHEIRVRLNAYKGAEESFRE